MDRIWIFLLLPLAAISAFCQSTFIYDQQSSTESNILEPTSPIQQNQPFGQSFTPALSSVGFIRLELASGFGNSSAATMDIDLRANSITGSILGTSEQVLFPAGGGGGAINFFFATPVTVTPGTTYYFQPVVLDNNNIVICDGDYGYSGGVAYANGAAAAPGEDLWFREGITVIPEPGLVSLLVLYVLACFGFRRWK